VRTPAPASRFPMATASPEAGAVVMPVVVSDRHSLLEQGD